MSRSRRREDPPPRSNPTARNEPFMCIACGAEVPATEHGMPRDHCPFCLVSVHVDEIPGDRASLCGGIMDATGYEVVPGGEIALAYRCRACGVTKKVRAVVSPEPFPDAWERML